MNIVIVDDDAAIRKSLDEFISRMGHRVTSCGDGYGALSHMDRERVHLVLSDIQMPGLDGHELLRRIRENPSWNDTVVVLFTGHGDIKSAVGAMRSGAYDYLLKPIDIRELAVMIERIAEFLVLKEEHGRLSGNFDEEVKKATRSMKRELSDLRKAYAREAGAADIGLFSESIRHVFRTARRLRKSRDISVLIEGETGTGKEVLARYIHFGSGSAAAPFIGVNCAAIPPTLFESELFGYEAGAFTGAKPRGQKGKLELARGGTIFLDEITEIPVEYQAKFLRVIQERRFFPVGGIREFEVDVRFICATNRDILRLVEEGLFREDLYYRLNAGGLLIPPLRERREEIIPLAEMFLSELVNGKRTSMRTIGGPAAKLLERYDWPGNVRQLKNTVERVALLTDDAVLTPEHLEFLAGPKGEREADRPREEGTPDGLNLDGDSFDLHGWTLDIVRKAMEKNRYNKSKTAQYLGITRNELYTFLKHLETSR